MYLQGFLLSFLELNSYLKIFTTSFLGAIFFKFLFIFVNPDSLIINLESLGLPVNNPDFIEYVGEVQEIKILNFVFLLVIVLLISSNVIKKLSKK